jgi:hypothetical protein
MQDTVHLRPNSKLLTIPKARAAAEESEGLMITRRGFLKAFSAATAGVQ